MTVGVRRLRAGDDVGAAARLLARFFEEEGFATPPTDIAKHVGEMVGLDVCGLFQAEAGGEAIGVTTASLEFGIEYGWTAEMGDLYVVPRWRGRGVAGQLIDAVEAFLMSRDAAGYQVTVTPHSERHRALTGYYRKLGFEDEGRRLLFKGLRASA